MSEEIKEILDRLLKYLKESNINNFGYEQDKLISYKEAQILLDYITNLQQKVEQLESIRKEAIEYIHEHQLVFELSSKKQIQYWFDEFYRDLLNILNKGGEQK